MKTLVIAEKPSVAADLARVLGKVPKKGDHFENDELVISSAVGHLVELAMPEDIKKEYKRWNLKDLPIIPTKFKLKPSPKTKSRFQELKELLARQDIGQVINACDAGREGELIFTYLYELAGAKIPVKRLWMSSMTPEAIREAFHHLRDGQEMQPLQDAARCRSEADWLIGINATRGATIQFGRRGGTAATVGRVQTPTLSLVYQREMEIRNFQPRDYWRIEARFQVAQGEYTGIYQKPDFKKGTDEHDRADRLWDQAQAQAILEAVRNNPEAEVTEEKKRTRQSAPRLYDLTTLQREANSRFGFPAGMTLSIAQALYEKHKMLTYPRTDSRALPEDYVATVANTLKNLTGEYSELASKVLANRWINGQDRRVFNNRQVSDHFAIIPTDAPPKKLQEKEQKIYDMVVRRFIAVFYPQAEFDVTTRLSTIGEHTFKTEGKVLAEPGWLAVYGRQQQGDDTLVALSPEDGKPPRAKMSAVNLLADATKPPPRYTEATLLAAMEGAGKLVEDEELAEAMKERGLGTPATRASIIEHLINERYLERQAKELVPTTKAEGLMEFLKQFDIEILTSPGLTGEWEYKLRQIEEGRLTREEFMEGIRKATKEIISKLQEPPSATTSQIISPSNGKPLLEDHRAWFSEDSVEIRGRKFPVVSINKVICGRRMTPEEVQVLLDKRELGPLEGFTSRSGKYFAATLKLVEKENGTLRVDFNFGNNGEGDPGSPDEVDLSQYPIVGLSPIDKTPVRETPNAYVSEGKDPDGKPAFRMSRYMLGQALSPDQIGKLLKDGKTDLIKGFKSKRTGRLFDAFLILKPDGGIGFEFPPRASGKTAPGKTAASKSTE